jgi:hypothetical protein
LWEIGNRLQTWTFHFFYYHDLSHV